MEEMITVFSEDGYPYLLFPAVAESFDLKEGDVVPEGIYGAVVLANAKYDLADAENRLAEYELAEAMQAEFEPV